MIPTNMPHKFSATIMMFISIVFAMTLNTARGDDIVITDFEATDYAGWVVEGDAFGSGPAAGTLDGQMKVSGYHGERLVNSYHGGDRSTGSLTSPAFDIEKPYINLLIGGGGFAGETEAQLMVDDRVVRTATGPNTRPGGNEALREHTWDVTDWIGKRARIRILDERTSGWGHINVDYIRQSDQRSAAEPVVLEKQLAVDQDYLLIPISNRRDPAQSLELAVQCDGATLQTLKVSLPKNDEAFWWAAYPLRSFDVNGKSIVIKPAAGSLGTKAIQSAFDSIHVGKQHEAWASDDFRQPYRNQFHVSTRRGWNNDPNGMVYHNGTYHLFYQHNPVGIFWGNMHWGHFTSDDLITWKEQPIKLSQNTTSDMMFSGGGFVDHHNTAGYGNNVLFVAFTSTGRGECLAYSTDDGQTFKELPENPVVKHSGRDPKIIWYPPESKWVMVVYNNDAAELTQSTPYDPKMSGRKHANLAFYESKDLHHWTKMSAFTDYDRDSVYECPEFFELPIEGKPGKSLWCLMAASNRYFLGDFDGRRFIKRSGPHGASRGAFYAPQTFSDTPDGRRIQIGWVRTASFEKMIPDQISNQCFTLPHRLTLRETDQGPRMFCNPVGELQKLRVATICDRRGLSIDEANQQLHACQDELTEVIIELSEHRKVELRINGIGANFDGSEARVFNDRTVNEIYVDGGSVYRVNARPADRLNDNATRLAIDGDATIDRLTIYRLKSIFDR